MMASTPTGASAGRQAVITPDGCHYRDCGEDGPAVFPLDQVMEQPSGAGLTMAGVRDSTMSERADARQSEENLLLHKSVRNGVFAYMPPHGSLFSIGGNLKTTWARFEVFLIF